MLGRRAADGEEPGGEAPDGRERGGELGLHLAWLLHLAAEALLAYRNIHPAVKPAAGCRNS